MSSSIDFGRFNVSAYNARGFVGKVSTNGTVLWLQAFNQGYIIQGKDSHIASCRLTSDGTKVVISGWSAEATITLGGQTVTKVGNDDVLVGHLDPATGTVSSLVGIGKSGSNSHSAHRLEKGTTGTVMYQFVQVVNGASFSDSGTLTCTSTDGSCCVVIKYTGTSRDWIQTIEDSSCGSAGLAVSEDGSLVFAGGEDSGIKVLAAGNGTVLASTSVGNMTEIQGMVVVGKDLYVAGVATGNATVDSVKIVGPNSVFEYSALIKFTISNGGATITAAAGTWIGTDELSANPYFLAKGYDTSGAANRLLFGLELRGSTLKSGRGFSKKFGPTVAVYGQEYAVGCNPGWTRWGRAGS